MKVLLLKKVGITFGVVHGHTAILIKILYHRTVQIKAVKATVPKYYYGYAVGSSNHNI